jgi:hypothetical protein
MALIGRAYGAPIEGTENARRGSPGRASWLVSLDRLPTQLGFLQDRGASQDVRR